MATTTNTALAKRSDIPGMLNQSHIVLFPADRPGDQPSTGIIKHTKEGLIRNIQVRVPVTRDQGEIYLMGGRDANGNWVDKPMLTLAAYLKANNVAGVSFRFPETIRGDGDQVLSNPHFVRDEDDNIRRILMRCIGVGRNWLGNYVARDISLSFDLETYSAQDLYAKWAGKKKDVSTAEWGTLFAARGDITKVYDRQKAYRVPGGLWLVVDLKSKEVVHLIGEQINRQKFAERNAQSICIRNIMKWFLGGRTMPNPDGTVTVVGWPQPDRDWAEIGEQFDQAERGRIVIDGQQINVQAENVQITGEKSEDREEVEPAIQGISDDLDERQQSDPDDEPDSDAGPGPVQQQQQQSDTQQLQIECRDLIQRLGGAASDDVASVLVGLRLGTVASLNESDASVLMAAREDLRKALAEREAKKPKAETKPAAEPKQGELLPGAAPSGTKRTKGDPSRFAR